MSFLLATCDLSMTKPVFLQDDIIYLVESIYVAERKSGEDRSLRTKYSVICIFLCCRSKHIHVREVIHPKIWVSHVPSSRQIIGEAGGCSVEGGGTLQSLELSVSSSAVSPPQGCGGCGWFHVNCNISLQFQQPYLYSIRKTENIYCAPAFPHLENRHNYFYQTSSWMWRQIKMWKV